MSRLFSFLALVSWSLWFGGLICLFLLIMALFAKSRAIAPEAAPHLFLAFERYQLVLAAIALTSTFAWRMTIRLSALHALFILLALAAFGAAVNPLYLTSKMEALRSEGKQSSPEFKQLHRHATRVYVAQAVLLFIGAFPLYAALRRQSPDLHHGTTNNPPPTTTPPTPA
jgi:hypothetical protein